MIIELYGLPASGKTTLARRLQANDDYVVVKIRSRFRLIFLNFIFFIKNIGLSMVTLWYLTSQGGSSRLLYYKFMNTFLHHNAKHIKAKKIPKAIIDEGLWQNCISLFDEVVSIDVMRSYIKLLPKPDRLVVFDLDKDVWLRHLEVRDMLDRVIITGVNKELWLSTIYQNHQTFIEVIQEDNIKCEYIKSDIELENILRILKT